MRVLLQIRPDYRARPGGDSLQAERTAEELRALGVEAELSGALVPDLDGYDLVHIFNTQLIDDPLWQMIRARQWGLPVALSTVYWNPDRFRQATREAGAGGQLQLTLDRVERARQRLVLGAARLLLPNSHAEAAMIAATFPGLAGLVRVVPNAVDARFAAGDGARFCARHGLTPRGFVLCAGRKEELKNQLTLIRACRDLALPLVLAGQETAAAAKYVAACRALAAESPAPVLFLPNLEHDELADAYAAARVHAQPSYYETVGLSSLEAALGGCNIVATRNSGLREYLDDDARYCDPEDPDAVREAVAAAWAAPPLDDLAPGLAAEYTWRRVAEETLRAYEEVLRMGTDESPTRWWPDLPVEEYVAHLEETIQLQLEAMAFRDAQYAELQEEFARVRDDLAAGLAAEQAERRRAEAGFRALEASAAEQGQYLANLEAELAARPPAAPPSRWSLRR